MDKSNGPCEWGLELFHGGGKMAHVVWQMFIWEVNFHGAGKMFPVGEEMFTCGQGKNYLWPQK